MIANLHREEKTLSYHDPVANPTLSWKIVLTMVATVLRVLEQLVA